MTVCITASSNTSFQTFRNSISIHDRVWNSERTTTTFLLSGKFYCIFHCPVDIRRQSYFWNFYVRICKNKPYLCAFNCFFTLNKNGLSVIAWFSGIYRLPCIIWLFYLNLITAKRWILCLNHKSVVLIRILKVKCKHRICIRWLWLPCCFFILIIYIFCCIWSFFTRCGNGNRQTFFIFIHFRRQQFNYRIRSRHFHCDGTKPQRQIHCTI